MKNITIIEDNFALNNGIALALKNAGYTFTQLYKLGDYNSNEHTDLIILDINLPDGNGFEFLKKLRETSEVPVVILTANDLETDEVMGLELGADDYITKPFSLMVLRARIDKVLKKKKNTDETVYRDEVYVFDFEAMEFTVNGVAVELSKTEQKLLRILVANKNRTLTRDQLIDRIWTFGAVYVDENALSVTINRLRKKLDAAEKIQTVYGIGYIWRAQ
ncbi:response regulator transcription factor [Ruminococcus sp.]|uniref:response regulator transcription factor n=1 Tax=Ruminococcus sp. TaxID=41978 RepID=UPI0025EB3C75|nr:response regulator transcription factor [Ruminococcus sp.]MBQ8966282.1 response regulator transcription factor [Ruminococcus sp.]